TGYGCHGRFLLGLIAPFPTARQGGVEDRSSISTNYGTTSGDPLEALCTVALALGLRQGEALGLTCKSVDDEAGVIRITHGLQKIGGKRVLVPLKTERTRRTLTMPTAVSLALRTHERLQRRRRRLAGTRWVDTSLVFTIATGTPLEGTSVTKRFQER